MAGWEASSRSLWVSPPCSGLSEFARGVRDRSGELGWFIHVSQSEHQFCVDKHFNVAQRRLDACRDDP
eukprot:12230930-Prorocentrum_lima.AAC.1